MSDPQKHYFLLLFLTLLILLNPYLFYVTYRKIKQVKDPNRNLSYSILTIAILYLLIFEVSIVNTQEIILFIEELNVIKDNEILSQPKSILRHIFWILWDVQSIFQIFEWILMALIIHEQKNKFIA